jgi:exopolysaccharide biosynthesis polyprenyl glycosylphosphotransferase
VVDPKSDPVPIVGRLDRLQELVERTGATDLAVALDGPTSSRRHRQIASLSRGSVRVHWVGDGRAATLAPDTPRPSTRRRQPRPTWTLRIDRALKRAIDFTAALVGLIVLGPLLATLAALVWISSGRPIFYTQERVGQGGRLFRIWKFRSMMVDAETSTGPIWATFHDQRCTRLGDWLRSTNLDELPQLWNVLRGDMSLVGPRPERPMFVDQFRAEMPRYDDRHAVPVGMTGWAQVHGWRGRTSLRKRLQYDLDYIRRWSLWLDLQVLAMTVQHVVVGKTRWRGRGRK